LVKQVMLAAEVPYPLHGTAVHPRHEIHGAFPPGFL
jgi:hypothetical protein